MTENTKAKKWDEAAVERLLAFAGGQDPVTADTVRRAAADLGVSERSVASKLRQLDRAVESLAKEKVAAFDAAETADLRSFVTSNAGTFTYGEIAEKFANGKFTAKQVQGKILALELTSSVKPTEKVEVARTYTEAEEAMFISMANGGKFIEDIAAALGKEIPSIRGKALSLTRNGQISKIPLQRDSHAKVVVDPVVQLGDAIHGMTVAEIAKAVDKTERGLKTLLTRRGIKVKDYDGQAKKLKAEKNAAPAA